MEIFNDIEPALQDWLRDAPGSKLAMSEETIREFVTEKICWHVTVANKIRDMHEQAKESKYCENLRATLKLEQPM